MHIFIQFKYGSAHFFPLYFFLKMFDIHFLGNAFLSNGKLPVYVKIQNNLVKFSPILCGFKGLFIRLKCISAFFHEDNLFHIHTITPGS